MLAANANSQSQRTEDNEETSEPRWYQVEVILFENLNPNAAEEERWGDVINFIAAENSLSLNDINTMTDSEEDTNTAQTEPGDTSTQTGESSDSEALDAVRQPLIYLDEEQRMLNKHALALDKNSNYRVMYHQSWLMVFNEGETSPPLLIHAGESYDQHHQLEGSLDIQLSRFLHVKSNFWLSSFSESFDSDDNTYTFSYSADDSLSPYQTANSPRYSSFSDSGFKYQTLMANEYDVEQTANLNNHSRLKSDELHYVDHPLMGMLIKINRAEETSPAFETEQ